MPAKHGTWDYQRLGSFCREGQKGSARITAYDITAHIRSPVFRPGNGAYGSMPYAPPATGQAALPSTSITTLTSLPPTPTTSSPPSSVSPSSIRYDAGKNEDTLSQQNITFEDYLISFRHMDTSIGFPGSVERTPLKPAG